MTQILAAPDFVRGQGLLTDVREVARSIGNLGKRLISCSTTVSENHQEVRRKIEIRHVHALWYRSPCFLQVGTSTQTCSAPRALV